MWEIRDVLGEQGPLARHVAGFSVRPQQQAMAEAVAEALEARSVLITEAGTGTGKTFAYLAPVLLSGRKVLISTGTRTLQDQLFHRDLPVVRDALGVPVTVALLKGRANYLCLHRLDQALAAGRFRTRQEAAWLQQVRAWAGYTAGGDIAELRNIPESAEVWPRVTSTADNCLGQECPRYGECHVAQARRAAQAADVVVINHHLLCADMVLKEAGFGDLLPGADAFVLDEAHQLPEVAARFFTVSLSAHQLGELARDAVAQCTRAGADADAVRSATAGVEGAVRELRLALGPPERRARWAQAGARAPVRDAVAGLDRALEGLASVLDPPAAGDKGLEHLLRRCQDQRARLGAVTGAGVDDDGDPAVRWWETRGRGFALHRTPLEVGDLFRGRMGEHPAAWIFTSATLAVGERFEHFMRRLGVEHAVTQLWSSPFDFAHHALFYLPPGLPDPNGEGYTRAVLEATLPVLEASGGRAFVLFTSHRALDEAAAYLEARIPYPLLVQGSAPRDGLLRRFRDLGNAVLLGTASFWEGVDVRGPALSCVVIDRLPFAPPDDPVEQARIDALRAAGGNPFMEHQVPAAVLQLKQGVGRLIRDAEDRGVLMLCDPRVLGKSYGRVFLRSLPEMPVTRELAVVRAFFAAEPGAALAGTP